MSAVERQLPASFPPQCSAKYPQGWDFSFRNSWIHGVHFSTIVFFYLKHLFVYLHLYLSHTVGRVSPWVRLRLRQFLNFQPRYTPLPLSTADIEIYSSGLGLFRLCPLNIKTNRQQIHHPEERAIQHLEYFKVCPDICTYKDDKKNARDALLLRTVHIYPWLAPVWPAITDVTQEAPTCLSLVFPTHSTARRSNPCLLLRISKQLNPLCWIINKIFQNWDRRWKEKRKRKWRRGRMGWSSGLWAEWSGNYWPRPRESQPEWKYSRPLHFRKVFSLKSSRTAKRIKTFVSVGRVFDSWLKSCWSNFTQTSKVHRAWKSTIQEIKERFSFSTCL